MRFNYSNLPAWGGSLLLLATLAVAPARADEKADALLGEVRATTAATQYLAGNITFIQQIALNETKFEGKFTLKRPNYARIELGEPLGQTIICDGKSVYTMYKGGVDEKGNVQYQYTKDPADPTGLTVRLCTPVTLFFHPGMIGLPPSPPKGAKPPAATTKLANNETIEGTVYQVVEVSWDMPKPTTTRFYIGPDKRLARIVSQRKDATVTYVLKNVKTDPTGNDREFSFTPPKNSKQVASLPQPASASSKDKPGKSGK